MKATCPCGGVTVTIPRPPEYLNSCNCSWCFRQGTLTGYFHPDEVTIEGEVKHFVRSDIEAYIRFPFCPTCGAQIGWESLEPYDRMGVNMRLFGPDALIGIPVRFTDGANWDEAEEKPPFRHAEVPFAHDAPF